MRTKLTIGLFLAAALLIVAGGSLFNRIGAQDANKKTDADEKKIEGNLFDVLKKDLEGKKSEPIVPPPIPPTTTLIPQSDGPLTLPLPVPPPDAQKPNAEKPNPGKLLEGPQGTRYETEGYPKAAFTPLEEPNAKPTPSVPPPLPPAGGQTQSLTFPPPPLTQPEKDAKPTFPPLDPKPAVDPLLIPPPLTPQPKDGRPTVKDINPVKPGEDKIPISPLPQQSSPQNPTIPPPLQDPNVKPDLIPPPLVNGGKGPTPEAVPFIPFGPMPMATIPQEVAKIKNCPWTLQIEMVDGKTIVTATVNKKHEFKIVCQSLDLQTGKGTLKASGKVTISGDALAGSCEHLSIPLMEDRLLLEGAAAVTIQKLSANVSDATPAAFELKGDTLNLRIGELEAGKFIQTSLRKVIDVNVKQAAAATPAISDKQWTSYGKLYRHESKIAAPDYRLEKSNGEVIAYLVAREGGSLDRFIGETISVLGTTEQLHGMTVLRVTHIAFPK